MTKTEKDTKARAHWLIDQLDDEATWEDVAYHVNVRASIERGLSDVSAGRMWTTDELQQRLGLPVTETTGDSGFDSERFDAMTDDDIDLSDIPELTEEQLVRLKVRVPMHKIPLLLDPDIYRWLKRNSRKRRDRINQCLRDLMESHDE